MKIHLHGYKFEGFDLPRWCAGVTTLSTTEDHKGEYPVKSISAVAVYSTTMNVCCDLLDDDEHLVKKDKPVEVLPKGELVTEPGVCPPSSDEPVF